MQIKICKDNDTARSLLHGTKFKNSRCTFMAEQRPCLLGAQHTANYHLAMIWGGGHKRLHVNISLDMWTLVPRKMVGCQLFRGLSEAQNGNKPVEQTLGRPFRYVSEIPILSTSSIGRCVTDHDDNVGPISVLSTIQNLLCRLPSSIYTFSWLQTYPESVFAAQNLSQTLPAFC